MGRSALIGACTAAAVLLCAGVFTWKWLNQPPGQLVPSLPIAPETSKGILSVQDLPPISKNSKPLKPWSSTTRQSNLGTSVVSTLNLGQDVPALFKFLADPPQKEHDRQQVNGQKESVLRDLDDRVAETPDIMNHLIRLLENKEADLVGRDYAAQHSVAMYNALNKKGGWTDEGRLKNALQNLLSERESTLAGTALLSLRTLATLYPEKYELSDVAEKSLEIAQDESASVLSRTTALKVAAEQGENSRVLALARQWVKGGKTTTQRIAAIAVLGELGEQSDYTWLTAERNRSPYWMHASIDHSIILLKKRLNNLN